MLLVLVLLLGAAAVCGRLGVWQLDRAQLRGDAAEEERRAELADAPTDPLADVLAPQTSFRSELVGHKVEARGVYEDDELLVPGRALDGRTGYLVLTPLRVDDAARPVLAVVRGWVADAGDAAAAPAPDGTVTITGYLQVGEAAGGETGAPDQVEAVSPAELVNRWGGPTYSGYLVLAASEPAQSGELALLPAPTLAGGGLNIQNLAYALQWWIFGGFAVLLWGRLVRDETRAAREELEGEDDAGDDVADDAGDHDPARVDAGQERPGAVDPGTMNPHPVDPGTVHAGEDPAGAPTARRSAVEADAAP